MDGQKKRKDFRADHTSYICIYVYQMEFNSIRLTCVIVSLWKQTRKENVTMDKCKIVYRKRMLTAVIIACDSHFLRSYLIH